MRKIAAAATGVAMSALVGGGTYGIEIVNDNAERAAISRCVDDFYGQDRENCFS